jgi:hypothetical protein
VSRWLADDDWRCVHTTEDGGKVFEGFGTVYIVGMIRKENFKRFKSIEKAGFNTSGNTRLRQFGRGCDSSERQTRCQIQQENNKSMGSSIRLLPRPDWSRDYLTMLKKS